MSSLFKCSLGRRSGNFIDILPFGVAPKTFIVGTESLSFNKVQVPFIIALQKSIARKRYIATIKAFYIHLLQILVHD